MGERGISTQKAWHYHPHHRRKRHQKSTPLGQAGFVFVIVAWQTSSTTMKRKTKTLLIEFHKIKVFLSLVSIKQKQNLFHSGDAPQCCTYCTPLPKLHMLNKALFTVCRLISKHILWTIFIQLGMIWYVQTLYITQTSYIMTSLDFILYR